MRCKEIINQMELLAPLNLALEWDNAGLLVGDSNMEVNTVLIALDVTDEVVEEAVNLKADLIISHHPIMYKPINKINNETPLGRRIIKLIENKICVYSSHTNLDIAEGGTNDALFNLLELENKEPFIEYDNKNGSLGRTGTLKNSMTLSEFAKYAKLRLGLDNIRFFGDSEKLITKVGLSTGAASDRKMFKLAKEKNCEVYVTGDIRYHESQFALEMDLCLIDATHYASEVIVAENLKNYLAHRLESHNISLIISKVNGQTFKNI